MVRPPTNGFGFPWQGDDICPCGTGLSFADCCLGNDGRPAMALENLLPPPPVSGERQKGCYMAETADCGGGLSREHYISRGLIDGPELRVRGMPWQQEEVAHYSPDNLVARILCRRHNSALSPLDAHAIRFFLAVEAGLNHAQRRSLSRQSQFFMTSGDGLELWAMKTLASLYASEIDFTTPGHRFRDFEPPMGQIVVELSSPNPRSLMKLSLPITQDAHEERVGRRAVSIGPIVDDENGQLSALLVRMHGIALVFNIDLPAEDSLPENEVARPDMIDLIGIGRTSRVFLSWGKRRREGGIVQIRFGHPRTDRPAGSPDRGWDRRPLRGSKAPAFRS